MASQYSSYGSQRVLQRPPRPSVGDMFGNGAEMLALNSATSPEVVCGFLQQQRSENYVCAASDPPRLYTRPDGTDFSCRQMLQGALLAHLIGPLERMRGTDDAVTRFKVAIQPGIPEMNNQRLSRALSPLCEAGRERAKDQSVLMTAWEQNLPVFEQYIKTHEYFVVRIVLSWLPEKFDRTEDGEMTGLIARAIAFSRLAEPELDILISVSNELVNTMTWMSRAKWPQGSTDQAMLKILRNMGDCARLIKQNNNLPDLNSRHPPLAQIEEKAAGTGSAGEMVREVRTDSPKRQDLDIDEVLKEIEDEKVHTPPEPHSPKKTPPSSPQKNIVANTTAITASEPALSGKKSTPAEKTSSRPRSGSDGQRHDKIENLPAAMSAPELPTQELSYLATKLGDEERTGRSGRSKNSEAVDRHARHKRRSMSPSRLDQPVTLPHDRGLRKSANMAQLVVPRYQPPGNTKQYGPDAVTFKEYLYQTNLEDMIASQNRGSGKKKSKREERRFLRFREKDKDKPSVRESVSTTKANEALQCEVVWRTNSAKLALILPDAKTFEVVLKILSCLPAHDDPASRAEFVKDAVRQAKLQDAEKTCLKNFYQSRSARTVETILLKEANNEALIDYLKELGKLKF